MKTCALWRGQCTLRSEVDVRFSDVSCRWRFRIKWRNKPGSEAKSFSSRSSDDTVKVDAVFGSRA